MTAPDPSRYTHEFRDMLAELDAFAQTWRDVAAPAVLSTLQRISTIESVGSSTRIEGAQLEDSAVATLLTQLEITPLVSRDEQEIAGYAQTLELIHESWASFPLSEGHICQLHERLLAHSTKDARHRGQYKSLPNHVVAFDEAGHEIGVIFETAEPFRTPLLMGDLVARTQAALEQRTQHPLVTIGGFVVEFLAVHPFQDGNGRLSRLLTTLLLLRAGYDHVPFASLEQVIEERKHEYYRALRATQATLGSDAPDCTPWLSFFLGALVEQKERLARKLRSAPPAAGAGEDPVPPYPKRPDQGTPPDQVHEASQHPLCDAILDELALHGKRSMRDLVEGTGANRSTLKLRLTELLETGRIQRHGRGRGTWYTR